MRRPAIYHHASQQKIGHISTADRVSDNRLVVVLSVLLLLTLTTWSYWPTMRSLSSAWQSDDDYSAGQLVPLVAIFFVWRDRGTLKKSSVIPCSAVGLPVLMLAETARIYGLLSMRGPPERYALVLTVAALVLLVAGWQVFRRVFWILLFLFLMVPLPGAVHNVISAPLQRVATTGSVLFLEAVGIDVSQQGNIVMLGENTPMAVAEACSGLRMLMAFVIVAAFIAYMVKRPRWQKGILLASSIPMAVVCNVVRIFVTAILMLHVSNEVGQKFFHDFAGFVMMPIAVMLLFGELSLMDRIFMPDSQSGKGQPGAKAESIVRARRKAPSPDVPDCA